MVAIKDNVFEIGRRCIPTSDVRNRAINVNDGCEVRQFTIGGDITRISGHGQHEVIRSHVCVAGRRHGQI